jgi:Ca2+-binding EF-hand superfamily protein
VLLRLHLLVDGQPAAACRQRYLDRLFTDLDRDGDGFLSKAEAARAPSLAFLDSFLQGGVAETGNHTAVFADLDTDHDGRVSRTEFDAYYRRGLADVRLVILPGDAGADVLTDVLFRLLDRDGDGKLSREELRRAGDALRVADFNGDEWITPDELRLLRPLRPDAGVKPPSPPRACLPRGALADLLGPPDLELRLRLDTQRPARPSDTQRAEVWNPTRRRMPLADAVGRTPTGDLRFAFPAGNVEADVQVADGPETSVRTLHQFIRQQFQAADADGHGVLTRRQAEDTLLAGLFDLADRDGDGRLTEQELTAFLDLHGLGAVSYTTLTVSDRSLGLFDLLDADGDGRLSLRELATAWDRLSRHDRDGDGKLSRSELPRRLQLRFVQGKAGPRPPSEKRAVAAPPARGPDWFRKMDRNGDGYVSRREWLGSEELFRRLDADGDGLISPEEAERLEKLIPPEKGQR